LKVQQTELFQFIRDQEAKKKWNAERAKAIKSDFPKEYWYGEDNLEAFKMNPNGQYATFRLTEEAKTKSEKWKCLSLPMDTTNHLRLKKKCLSKPSQFEMGFIM